MQCILANQIIHKKTVPADSPLDVGAEQVKSGCTPADSPLEVGSETVQKAPTRQTVPWS